MLRIRIASALILCLCSTACTGSDPIPTTSGPTTVEAAADGASRGVLTLRIGAVVNTSAPTADRDRRTVDALRVAAAQTNQGIGATVEMVSIDDLGDVGSAVASLAERGVTVVVGTCDGSTTGALLEAATSAGLLATTGCAALPRPTDLGDPRPLLFDLASLHDAADVMATYLAGENLSTVAVLRSTLVGDVENACLELERAVVNLGGSITLSGAFSELVESPTSLLESSGDQLAAVDAFAVCALPPVLDETVTSIREAGYEEPVVIPWFGADARWSASTSGVIVLGASAEDDPVQAVREFFDAVGEDAKSADVIAADTVRMLVAAAARAASVGAQRLEAMLLAEELQAASGPLRIDPASRRPIGRAYRAVEIDRGRQRSVDLLTAEV